MPHILLAASSDRLARALDAQLVADGHQVERARTRQHAAALLAGEAHDALLLAALERPADAFELLRDLRADHLGGHARAALPVVTLAPPGGGAEAHALRAYEAGSDHHLAARTSYPVLHAALMALLRRHDGAAAACRRVGPIEIDAATREVLVHGRPVALTATEFRLLTILAAQPTRVLTKDELLRDVWGYRSTGRTRTLDSHAARLRRKLGEHGHRAVINIWGVGYRLIDGPLHQA